MAQEEPEAKRFKYSVISEHVNSAELQDLFRNHWHGHSDVKTESLEVISKPFRVCRISNFLTDEEFMDEIKNELLDVKSRRNSIDLYQFEQTSDLADVDTKNIKLLYQTFQTDLATWMERNTGIPLNNKISMSSSCYSDTDYLLCHDDNMGDRRIAFILYLSKNWTAEDGGALDLFDTDENGLPRDVVKSVIPQYNSLVFFEVVDNSYHQVAEVVSPDKSRWSINGWFHGPLRESSRPPRPDIQVDFIEPVDMKIDLNSWITDYYLYPNIVKQIQQDVEQESVAFLSNFLKPDAYDRLMDNLTSDTISWKKVGPADLRNYEVADETTLPDFLKDFYNMFKSISVFQLLKEYTELDLVPTETMKPKMTIELQRWTKGCYTLISDKSVNDTPHSERKIASEAQETSKESKMPEECNASETEVKEQRSTGKKSLPKSECDTPSSSTKSEDINEGDILKRILKGKSPKSKKKVNGSQSSKADNSSPQKTAKAETDDSDVSDIEDYLSDPLDCSVEYSDQEEDTEDPNNSEPCALDIIMQFHTNNISEDDTIDYVDPKEREGALIHIPSKDNHLCLVYKTLGTCRVHKYVNHYCRGYFYNLICTYYE